MRISNAFPSNYLKAADLQDRSVTVTMSHVLMEDIGGDHKPILYFQGKEKGLVLNKTNSNNIAHLYGDETDSWVGQEIELFPTIVDFQGRSVDAIRVRKPRSTAHNHAAPLQKDTPPPQQAPEGPSDLDDEIPF